MGMIGGGRWPWRPADDADGYPRPPAEALTDEDRERLRPLAASYAARFGLIEHFTDQQIARLRFHRWLRETGQLHDGEGI